MTYTATVRRCILLAALIVAATVLFVGGSAQAALGNSHDLDTQTHAVPSALHVAHKATRAKTPCKRHKAHARHDCEVCAEYAIVAPVSRTRANAISPKFKLVVADTLADQLAQAAAQASARLILADTDSQLLRSVSAGVIARTGRIRN